MGQIGIILIAKSGQVVMGKLPFFEKLQTLGMQYNIKMD